MVRRVGPPHDSPLLGRIIGDDQVMARPYWSRRVTYADYASGRAPTFIEDVMRKAFLA
jgi:hypothetical protein